MRLISHKIYFDERGNVKIERESEQNEKRRESFTHNCSKLWIFEGMFPKKIKLETCTPDPSPINYGPLACPEQTWFWSAQSIMFTNPWTDLEERKMVFHPLRLLFPLHRLMSDSAASPETTARNVRLTERVNKVRRE